MSIYFISDLHLHESRRAITQRFFKFLQEEAYNAQELYILGDFFEAWIGDDCLSLHDQKVLETLKTYAGRVPTYFMQGNRDFLIKESLLTSLNIHFLKDPSTITLDNQNVLLMHGDGLCLKDVNYQRFRKFVRLPFIQWFFLKLPLKFRQNIAIELRKESKKKPKHNKKPRDLSIYDVTDAAVQGAMLLHHAPILIHGHTHKPCIHEFTLNYQPYKRIVLGDWGQKSTILKYDNGQFELQDLLI